MLRRDEAAAADRGAEQDRERHLAAEHVVDLRRLIDDLVHGDKTERDLPPIGDRAEAATRGTDRHTGEGGLSDRRRLDPLFAKLLQERRDCVGRHVEDLGVAPHLLGDRLERGLVVGQLSHDPVLAQAEKTSSVACSGSGKGLASAKATAASIAPMMSRSIACNPASSSSP